MKQKTPKISIGFLTSLLFIGFIGPNKALSTTAADFPATAADGGKFYPATLLTPEIAAFRISQTEVQKLRGKAIKKRLHFSSLNAFTIQNPDNGKTYTLLSGFTPMPHLKEHEIDALKILCGSNSESLRNVLHFSDFHPFEGGNVEHPFEDYVALILPEFTQNLKRYFSFLQVALSDRGAYNALEFYKERAQDLACLFSRLPAIDRKARLQYFEREIKKIEADLKGIQGVRVYPLSDFFHTEMLLSYAIENDIDIQDFNFGTFKRRPLFLMCSFNEMCPKCEGLFGKYLRRNSQQQFIVAYINEQTSHKKRTFVAEPPLKNFFKVHVPMPKTKSPPKAKPRSTALRLLPSALLFDASLSTRFLPSVALFASVGQ
ncbi:MAG: hypothetical protein LBF34_04765 [Puniceicoccales bacterium]|jgi:hypothetical protein|nr:hypothetical protein [Puniceicoccales bacterium]